LVVYADDIALYQIIQSPEDYLLVQYDINAVFEWTTAKYLPFNYRKCCHLLFSRKRSPTLPVTPLEINGSIVNQADEYKYLGVKFYLYSETHTLLHLYQSLICPHLEMPVVYGILT